jgi:hypothetical protein
MGLDIHVWIVHGYKIPLARAPLDFNLLDSDDYQIIEEIPNYVTNAELKTWLAKNPEWKIHILTSSQNKIDIGASYMFLFDNHQKLFSGRVPDYESDTIDITFQEPPHALTPPVISDMAPYDQHWIVEGSW